MALRQRTGSTVCPGCGTLVGVNDDVCYNCGRHNPALWGFSPLLRRLGRDLGFTNLVMGSCAALYVATLLATQAHSEGGPFSFSPDSLTLFLFGASGSLPVFVYGHWWTLLSAGWLHGGLIHIALNMYSVRQIAPATAEMYGAARTVIIYVLGGAAGFLLSSVAGHYLGFLPHPLGGSRLTIGASAPLFGLIGALYYYGQRTGSSQIRSFIATNAIIWVAWGVLMPGIDNYAHGGGFLGGYITARVLDPLTRERVDHMLIALVCLVASALAIGASLFAGIPAQ